ncbi:MAG: acetylornithine deacetylase [Gammaproteobacteria bacterium]
MKTDTTRILTDLIAFDTTSRNSNLQLIEYAQSMLADHGVASDLVFDAERNKANLFATLGAGDAPGIVLSGHTDVVPVDGQDWRTDPFAAEVIGDKLYGRGSCDMKGFIAMCLAHIGVILKAKLKVPVHFAFSYDEEVGCIGVAGLLAELARREIRPRACIIGEPTSMGVVRAHKGMLSKRCRVRGRSGHSSLTHLGVNAVAMAAETVTHIHAIAERIAREGPFDHGFTPPHTTLHAGVIHGGTVNNIIPNECEFVFEIRNLPKQPPLALFEEVEEFVEKTLLPKMHAVSADTGFDWQTVSDYPGLDTEAGAAVIGMVSQLLDGGAPGKVCYGTEGGLFDRAGIPAVVCGPGSIEQAHKPDEYVELAQLARGEKFLRDLVGSLR